MKTLRNMDKIRAEMRSSIGESRVEGEENSIGLT